MSPDLRTPLAAALLLAALAACSDAPTAAPPEQPSLPEAESKAAPVSGPVAATAQYGSDASAITTIVADGTIKKTLALSSFLEIPSGTGTLAVSFRTVGAQTSCGNTAEEFDSETVSGTGPVRLSASVAPRWQGVARWEVVGTHTWNAPAGTTGGGTFRTSDFACG